MADGGDFKFQLSVKFGAGGNYDPHMLNIKGDTAEEFAANLRTVQDHAEQIVGAAQAVVAVSNAGNAGLLPQPQAQPTPQPQQQGGWADQPQPQQPQGGQGQSALGQPVRGFAGPNSKQPGREWRARKVNGKNQFVNQGDPDWYAIGRELGIQEQ